MVLLCLELKARPTLRFGMWVILFWYGFRFKIFAFWGKVEVLVQNDELAAKFHIRIDQSRQLLEVEQCDIQRYQDNIMKKE